MPRQLRYFALFWVLTTIYYLGFSNNWLTSILFTSTFVSGILSVLYQKNWTFLVFVSIETLTLVSLLPEIPNVLLFKLFTNFTILIAAYKVNWNNNWQNWLHEFLPAARLILIGLYLFSFFHKLNYDYLAVDTSCVSMLMLQIHKNLSFIPGDGVLVNISIWMSLLFELGIPILLLFARTRPYAVMIGLFFHLILGRSHYDFSAAMMAAYLLFLPEQTFEFIDQLVTKFIPKNLLRITVLIAAIMMLVVASYIDHFTSYKMWMVVWFSFGVCCTAVWTYSIWQTSRVISSSSIKMQWYHLLIPLILVFNGLSPYLGLKTDISFSMYSNLKTEGGQSNHVIIRKTLDLFDYNNQLVELKENNLQTYYEGDTWIERELLRQVRKQIRKNENYIPQIRYQRLDQGKVEIIDRNDTSLNRNWLTFLGDKFLFYRPLVMESRQPCVH